ncbi:MAG: xylulokinase [Anaerolineae bacterium]|nr:xylulokinase [Anaerolineae bacterium]
MSQKHFILAHDLGTTGNKATLYNTEGRLVSSAFAGYGVEYAHSGWAEQNPEDWWQAVCISTQKLLQQARVGPADIACLVFSGQMMGCVPLDKSARPLRNAIIWADQRAVAQERWLSERVTPAEMYRITGHRLSASYTVCKILWLRDHQPDIYRATYKFVQAKDALVARLTGEFVTDHSDASSTNLYHLEGGDWSGRILEATQLGPDQLPALRRSIDVVGQVRTEVADEVGLAPGTPVVMGAGDGLCAAAGAGVVAEGDAFNYVGSSSWIALATQKPIYDPEYKTFSFAHLVPGMFSPCGTMQAAGASYQWTRDQLCSAETQAAAALGLSPYELMNLSAEQSPAGARGLLFLPYLLGERSPRWNPRARGGFVGLTVRHRRADMVRATLEGITLNLRVILDAFTGQGAHIEAMRVIGGGARGRFWNKIMADVYGLPVHRLAILEEATSMGAALAGGVGVGLYPDFSMAKTMNEVVEVIEPDPTTRLTYEKLYPIFEATYHALTPIYDMLAEAGI